MAIFGIFTYSAGRSPIDDYDDPDGASPPQKGCASIVLTLLAAFIGIVLIFKIYPRPAAPPNNYPPPYRGAPTTWRQEMPPRRNALTITPHPTTPRDDRVPLRYWVGTSLPPGLLTTRAREANARTPTPAPTPSPTPAPPARAATILVDDFRPQPYPGEVVYHLNRLDGERRAANDGSILTWGRGVVTTTIAAGVSWGGGWMSLNHPLHEALPLDFSAILPSQILPAYQSRITGLTAVVVGGTPGKRFRLELKERGDLRWSNEVTLTGGRQIVSFDLPALQEINELLWVLDDTAPGDYVVLESLSFTATTPITDTATAAFVWSYGMLLNNWDPTTGLVRDKAKDASGEFDAIQDTGALAAATAQAAQLGVISRADAIRIVRKISDALLLDLPRYHGLWPHFVNVSAEGEIVIAPGVEWSSVDTAIAALALLDAQSGLGLDTKGTEQMLRAIDWDDLLTPNGISHGYAYSGDRFPYSWDVFGSESWLVDLAYASAAGEVAPMPYPLPPTANGAGFIDEMAWLFAPPPAVDVWGADWAAYRPDAADAQISYYPAHDSASCFSQLGLFGLSAGEIPAPSPTFQGSVYQTFGVGGRFAPANDGTTSTEAAVVMPHYAALIASLRSDESIAMWAWLIEQGYFTPLTNVESLSFPSDSPCNVAAPVWNQLKGSWNLSLQTLGWGRYLAQREGQAPILWQAAEENAFLRSGYRLLAISRE